MPTFMNIFSLAFLFLMLSACYSFGQIQSGIIVKGKVIDLENAEPIPFANVYFKGTSIVTTTDFNGEFELKTSKYSDSLTVQYVGYVVKSKMIDKSLAIQQIDFQLQSTSSQLDEIVVKAGENPAWRILRNIVKNKPQNNINKLSALEFKAYTRNQICLDKISDKVKKNLIVGNIATVIDNAQKVVGEDGKPVIPIFVSEVISTNYLQNNPKKTKEVITNSKISGIGIGDNTTINQFVGTGLQGINFYNNYSSILTKDFLSPICDEWRLNYKYYLLDSVYINNRYCYEIKFYPRNKFDLAYSGKMWIDRNDFSLVQIDVMVPPEANINYINKIKVQQEFIKFDSAWVLSNARLLIDVAELSSFSSGILIKTNSTYYDYVSSNRKPIDFFNVAVEVSTSDSLTQLDFDSIRPVKLSLDEKKMYTIIDSVKNIPKVKSWLQTMDVLVSGYKPIGKIEIGPYPVFYAFNQFEKHRFRIGFRTNQKFSKVWNIRSYIAFSTGDPTFIKPEIDISRIVSKKRFCQLGIKYHFDAEQVGISSENINFNSNLSTALFSTFSRFGSFKYPYYLDELSVYLNTELKPGLQQNVTIRNRACLPMFPFAYRLAPSNSPDTSVSNYFTVSEIVYELHYKPGESIARTKRNKRIRVKANKESFTYFLKYTYGSKIHGDFEYHKINLGVNKSFRLGFLGRSNFDVNLGYTPNVIVFPILFVHQGNESPVYLNTAFNQMNYLEFVSDKYACLIWNHNFEGLFFNRIPLIQKWDLRAHATSKILFGHLSQANRNLQIDNPLTNLPGTKFGGLDPHIPYIEVGYGISNILKCLRVDFIHRLTYLRAKDHSLFSVKLSLEIKI